MMNSLDMFSFGRGPGFGLLLIWSLFWKGISLWKAARSNERYWFGALLVINTAGILELLYLFVFGKDKLTLTSSSPSQHPTKPKSKKK